MEGASKIRKFFSPLLSQQPLLVALVLILVFAINYPSLSDSHAAAAHHLHRRSFLSTGIFSSSSSAREGAARETILDRKKTSRSLCPRDRSRRFRRTPRLTRVDGDGVLGFDNFNDYYDPSLKRARQDLLKKQKVFMVEICIDLHH
ncbi:unnamed protein product [Arabis nemorensis]|uniref:Uncharacterized protein n=1 Tax=Arabis nemorensis TaxID=586526 RepID=A0A565ARG8_9BRAS|nr:unnamed protein product [Arabis nemorensis]